jgi:hypothetical protein
MGSWYVAYRNGGSTVMHVYGGRDDAVAAARGLLERGRDVTEVGPMAGDLADGARLDGDNIRRLCERMRAGLEPRPREPA